MTSTRASGTLANKCEVTNESNGGGHDERDIDDAGVGGRVGVTDDETAATVVVVRMITSLAMAVTDDGARGNR